MPFSFVEIEGAKTRSVRGMFLALLVFYFLGFLLIRNVYASFYADLWKGRAEAPSVFAIPIYVVMQVLSPRVPPPNVLGLTFLAALLTAFFHWTLATHRMIERILNLLGTKALDPEDRYHAQFRNVVEELSVASGGRRFEPRVVNNRCLNAFALQDFQGRAVIGVTEGLLSKLNRRQLEAVVGHEAAHVLWGDCLSVTVACAVSGVFAGDIKKAFMREAEGEPEENVFMAGASFAVFFFPLFLLHALSWLLTMFISREKEHRADATAVRLTRDPVSLAESLRLIVDNPRGSGLAMEEVAHVFILSPKRGGLQEKEGFLADLFSTHPPVEDRIRIVAGLAGASPDSIASGLRGRAREEAEIPPPMPSISVPPAAWHVLIGDAWQGPFDLTRLAVLEGFTPDTWVKSAGGAPRPAHDFQELMPVFKGTAPLPPLTGVCRSCARDLDPIQIKGVPVWRCNSCAGHMVKRDKVSRLLARENMDFPEEVKKLAWSLPVAGPGMVPPEGGKPSGMACPSCGQEMLRKPLAALYPYFMEVEECDKCALLWFDKHELEAVQFLGQTGDDKRGVLAQAITIGRPLEKTPPRIILEGSLVGLEPSSSNGVEINPLWKIAIVAGVVLAGHFLLKPDPGMANLHTVFAGIGAASFLFARELEEWTARSAPLWKVLGILFIGIAALLYFTLGI